MSKRLFINLAPLIAIAALALMPTVAAAASWSVYVSNERSSDVSEWEANSLGLLSPPPPAPTETAESSPRGVALSRDDQYLYVANHKSNSVSEYKFLNGKLQLLGHETAGKEPNNIATAELGPGKAYAYVAAEGPNEEVLQYEISGGALKPLSPAYVTAGEMPDGIATTHDTSSSSPSKCVFVTNNREDTVASFAIKSGGELEPLATGGYIKTPREPEGIAVTKVGNIEYAYVATQEGIAQYEVQPSPHSCQLTSKGTVTGTAALQSRYIAVTPKGQYAYATEFPRERIAEYKIGLGGVLTPLPGVNEHIRSDGEGPLGLAVTPGGNNVYVADWEEESIVQYKIGSGGELQFLSPESVSEEHHFPPEAQPFGIAIRPPCPKVAGPPQWCSNGSPLQKGLRTSVTTYGSLTLSAGGYQVTCQAADAETIENPTNGAAGTDEFNALTFYECLGAPSPCPGAELAVVAKQLSLWKSRLISGSSTKDEIENIELEILCNQTKVDTFTGTLTPTVSDGVLMFGVGSGTLFDANTNSYDGTIAGEDNILGFSTSEHIAATPPAFFPKAGTGGASSVTQTTATLNATVNPNGWEVGECKFEYGTTSSYGSSAPCTPSPGSGEEPVAVSTSVKGLAANTTYHFRIVANNAEGTGEGSDQTLTTLPNPPTVVTKTASSITQTSATLNATVNPNGGAVSECKLEYGTTTAYGSSAACTPSPGSGTSPVAVSASVTGLSPGTTYHFRISATNAGGTSNGSDQAFATQPVSGPAAHWYRNGVLIGSSAVQVVSWGTLTLKDPSGEVTCHDVAAGYVMNPAGKGAGEGATQIFAAYGCESIICAESPGTVPGVEAKKLPWPSVLEHPGSLIRQKSTGVVFTVGCAVPGKEHSLSGVNFIGATEPSVEHGTSALHPAFEEFGTGAGELEQEGSGGAVTGTTEGQLRTFGSKGQEIINVE